VSCYAELRPILDEAIEIFGDKSEYLVAAPQDRAAANTAMGWKNSNLRTEMTRLLRRAGVSGWPRLFHASKLQEGRASRQTELQREFPLHVVCSWLGNSPRIAQQRCWWKGDSIGGIGGPGEDTLTNLNRSSHGSSAYF
jgi:hypothetical protein